MSDERSAIARELSSKYSLHADQAGEFERAYLFMLLGIATPEEFVTTLSKVGLTQDIINGLATDVNTRVFMRLRDEERKAVEVKPVAPPRPAPLPPPALDYQPAAQTLPGSPVAAPMPSAAPEVVTSVAPVLEPTPQIMHVMPSATQSRDWHPAAAVHIYVPTHQTQSVQPPTPESQAAEVPVPPPQEVYIAPPAPQPTPISAPAPGAPIQKAYSADPYREPVQ